MRTRRVWPMQGRHLLGQFEPSRTVVSPPIRPSTGGHLAESGRQRGGQAEVFFWTDEVMGTASKRRKQGRQKYLQRLAGRDPQKFKRQWAKRLESWSYVARQHAGKLAGPGGQPVPGAFEMVRYAMAELAACGQAAMAIEAHDTIETMNDECCKAVAAAVDHRLHRLSNAYRRRQHVPAVVGDDRTGPPGNFRGD